MVFLGLTLARIEVPLEDRRSSWVASLPRLVRLLVRNCGPNVILRFLFRNAYLSALAVAVLLLALVSSIILLVEKISCIVELRRRIKSICPSVLPRVVILTLGRSMNRAGNSEWNPGNLVELTSCSLARWAPVASETEALELLRRMPILLVLVKVPAVLSSL